MCSAQAWRPNAARKHQAWVLSWYMLRHYYQSKLWKNCLLANDKIFHRYSILVLKTLASEQGISFKMQIRSNSQKLLVVLRFLHQKSEIELVQVHQVRHLCTVQMVWWNQGGPTWQFRSFSFRWSKASSHCSVQTEYFELLEDTRISVNISSLPSPLLACYQCKKGPCNSLKNSLVWCVDDKIPCQGNT